MKKFTFTICCLLCIVFTALIAACDFFEKDTGEKPSINKNGKIGDTLINSDIVSI